MSKSASVFPQSQAAEAHRALESHHRCHLAVALMTPYVHLRLHSEYSLTDGICTLPEGVAAAADDGMPALGISDAMNLFGMVKFYKAARARGSNP